MKMRLAKVALSTLIFPASSWAVNQFVNPPKFGREKDFLDNPVYRLGATIELQWKTDLASVDILMWQETGGDAGASLRVEEETGLKRVNWTVEFPENPNPRYPNVYYLAMYKPGDIYPSVLSHYFNISGPTTTGLTATTIVIATRTTTVEPAPTTSATSAPSLSSAPTPHPNTEKATQGQGFSGGEVAAIAIGAVLGVLIVVAMVGWLVWRNLRGKRADGAHPSEQETFVNAREKPETRAESVAQLHSEPLLVQDPSHLRHELAAEPYSRNDGAHPR
ncbi:hypothetical protein LX36DRAFT_747460 [Colletotrichum falcatum]|nr:hypothetical protein LX36DRAFT_747460 [Colletotrichum falcatum]